MNRAYYLARRIANIALREVTTETVRVDAKHVDGVAPELVLVGDIFHREGDAAGVVFFDQAVLMDGPRLSLAGALVASVVADDARVVSKSLGMLSHHIVGADVSRRRPPGIRAHFGKKRANRRKVEDAERLHR